MITWKWVLAIAVCGFVVGTLHSADWKALAPPAPGCSPPTSGDWVVIKDTLCSNVVLKTDGEVYVRKGAQLTLDNVVLTIRTAGDGALHVDYDPARPGASTGGGRLVTGPQSGGGTTIHGIVEVYYKGSSVIRGTSANGFLGTGTSNNILATVSFPGGIVLEQSSVNTLSGVSAGATSRSEFRHSSVTTISSSTFLAGENMISGGAKVDFSSSEVAQILWTVGATTTSVTRFTDSTLYSGILQLYETQQVDVSSIDRATRRTEFGTIKSLTTSFRIDAIRTWFALGISTFDNAYLTVSKTYLQQALTRGASINSFVDVTYYGWQSFVMMENSQNVIDGLVEERRGDTPTGIRFQGSSVSQVRHSEIVLAYFQDGSSVSLSDSIIEHAFVCSTGTTVDFGYRQSVVTGRLSVDVKRDGSPCPTAGTPGANLRGPVDFRANNVVMNSAATLARVYPTHVVGSDFASPRSNALVEVKDGATVVSSGTTDVNGDTSLTVAFDATNYQRRYDVFVDEVQLNRKLGLLTETPFELTVAPPVSVRVDASLEADDCCNFDTLAEGVETVASGGTVAVAEGAYSGAITIERAMTIHGDSQCGPVFQVDGPYVAITVATTGAVTIENLGIRSDGQAVGVRAMAGSQITVRSSCFTNVSKAVAAESGSLSGIFGNVIESYKVCDQNPLTICAMGVELFNPDPDSTVTGNRMAFSDDAYGILVQQGLLAEISGNTIRRLNPPTTYVSRGESAGIYLEQFWTTLCPSGTRLLVSENHIEGFWWGVSGVGSNAVIEANTIVNVHLGVGVAQEEIDGVARPSCMHVRANTIQHVWYIGVQVDEGSYALIEDNVVDDIVQPGSPAGIGVRLVYAWGGYPGGQAEILGNTISRAATAGIKTYRDSSALIRDNYIYECPEGVSSDGDDWIEGNILSLNDVGVAILNPYARVRQVLRNWIFDSTSIGISIWEAGGSLQVIGNTIISRGPVASEIGIRIRDTLSTPGVVVSGNVISQHVYGIYVMGSCTNLGTGCDFDIYANEIRDSVAYGAYVTTSQHFRFYHNNFIDNVMGLTSQAFDDGTGNLWYLPLLGGGGNYWSDHVCIDADGNGICENPYQIDGGPNWDMYPLAARVLI